MICETRQSAEGNQSVTRKTGLGKIFLELSIFQYRSEFISKVSTRGQLGCKDEEIDIYMRRRRDDVWVERKCARESAHQPDARLRCITTNRIFLSS